MSSAKTYSVSWFNLFAFPNLVGKNDAVYGVTHDLHHVLFLVLVGVAALHVAGALKHHFIDRNDVLKRMLPFGRVK
jgi:cytochrome b561